VANFNRALSLRRYQFLRASDGKLLVRGETQWVFVSAQTGRPLRIPTEIQQVLPFCRRTRSRSERPEGPLLHVEHALKSIPGGEIPMRKTFTLEYWQDEGWYVGQLGKSPASSARERPW